MRSGRPGTGPGSGLPRRQIAITSASATRWAVISLHRPADDLSRAQVDHGRDIEPPSAVQTYEVRNLPLVRPLRDELPVGDLGLASFGRPRRNLPVSLRSRSISSRSGLSPAGYSRGSPNPEPPGPHCSSRISRTANLEFPRKCCFPTSGFLPLTHSRNRVPTARFLSQAISSVTSLRVLFGTREARILASQRPRSSLRRLAAALLPRT